MIQFGPQHEYARERRVRLIPLGTADLKIDGGSLYSGVTREEWRSWPSLSTNSKGVDRRDRVTITANAHIILVPDLADGGYTVFLYGTGVGQGLEPQFTKGIGVSGTPRLEKEMKKIGLKPDHVDYVILPSLHYLTGLNLISMSNRGDCDPVCPDAEYLVHADEYRLAMSGEPATRGIYRGVRREIDMLERKIEKERKLDKQEDAIWKLEPSEFPVGNFVNCLHHPGVTDGHLSLLVTLNSEQLLISPLLFPTPMHLNPEVQFGFGLNRRETHMRKVEILETLWQDRTMLLFAMDPGHTVGYINKSKSGDYSIERVGDALY